MLNTYIIYLAINFETRARIAGCTMHRQTNSIIVEYRKYIARQKYIT